MSDNDTLQQTANALRSEWDLPDGTLSEEALLQLLADRIAQVITRGPEVFFQLMYRLDISEKKLTATLNDKDVALKIARLVYDRQLQKIQSKRSSAKDADIDDPELKW